MDFSKLSYCKSYAKMFVECLRRGENKNIKRMGTVTIIEQVDFLIQSNESYLLCDCLLKWREFKHVKHYIVYQDRLGWVAVQECDKRGTAIEGMKKYYCWRCDVSNALYFARILTHENENLCYLVTGLSNETITEYIKLGMEEKEKVEFAISLEEQ